MIKYRLYDDLGVSSDVDDVTLRRVYRRLTSEHRPDKNPGNPHAAGRYESVQTAYEVLSDSRRRAIYDEFGDASLKKGFDPEKAREKIARARAEARRLAQAAMLSPTAVPRRDPADDAAAGRRDWDLKVGIGPRMARSGGALRIPVSRPITCPRCDGGGRNTDRWCGVCGGERKYTARKIEPCVDCHGYGTKVERVVCKPCGGTGYRSRTRHKTCGGAGTVNKFFGCGVCHGHGVLVSYFEKPCDSCKATGDAACARCDGNGAVYKRLMFRFRVPSRVVDGACYRYVGAGFSTHNGAPSDLYVRFTVLAKAPRR